MIQSKTLVVVGERTATEVIETARLMYASDFSVIEQMYFDETRFVEIDRPRLHNTNSAIYYHVGIASDELKLKVVRAFELQGWTAFTVVHPTAVVSPSAQLAVGVFVGPLAVVSSNAIVEKHSIIHIHASIGHDARIGSYSAVLPGARISGKATIGQRTLVGSNAFVAAGKSIGDDCRIDALTYVNQDLADNHILSSRFARPVPRVQ